MKCPECDADITVARPRRRHKRFCGEECRAEALRRRQARALERDGATRSNGHSPEPGAYNDPTPVTVAPRQVAKDAKHGRGEYRRPRERRPVTRADCKGGLRPCPWVGCIYNLYLDVARTGGLKLNFPDQDPTEVEHSCALDVADEGGTTLDAVGVATNVCRERVRQIEDVALASLKVAIDAEESSE